MNKLVIVIACALLIVIGLSLKERYPARDAMPPSPSVSQSQPENHQRQDRAPDSSSALIDQLTRQDVVVKYVRQYKRLPNYYITKNSAREQGWDARDGNLCSVLPNKAIGGDRFSNREGSLPMTAGRIWYEADINYRCGHRGAERLMYSNDGLIYVTHDHYKGFTEVKN
ncbi:MAG: ribonuclease [Enterobacteriaceae bacterium]|nr:ribonuclease [Enterobacteriaceae bacterium]